MSDQVVIADYDFGDVDVRDWRPDNPGSSWTTW
jgi:hypothetical protein